MLQVTLKQWFENQWHNHITLLFSNLHYNPRTERYGHGCHEHLSLISNFLLYL